MTIQRLRYRVAQGEVLPPQRHAAGWPTAPVRAGAVHFTWYERWGVWVCLRCGSVVPDEFLDQHNYWHDMIVRFTR